MLERSKDHVFRVHACQYGCVVYARFVCVGSVQRVCFLTFSITYGLVNGVFPNDFQKTCL